LGPAAPGCLPGRVTDTDGPALCFRIRCVRVIRAVLWPGRGRVRMHGSLLQGRGHCLGPPRTDSRPRAPALKFDGPVCRPEPNGPSAGGYVPRHSAFGRIRAGPPPGGRLGPSPAGVHGRLRVAPAGAAARGHQAPSGTARAACCRGQYPAAQRPSVPRGRYPQGPPAVSSPGQFPMAHEPLAQSVPRGSRAVSSPRLTGRQFPVAHGPSVPPVDSRRPACRLLPSRGPV